MTGITAASSDNVPLSVIVPFHNSAAYIEACLQALALQDYPLDRYEVTFVDNGSVDRSREIVERYPRNRLLTEAKRGSYAARNCGVKASSGTILCFTDADCAPSPNWLRTIEQSMRDEQTAIVLGQVATPSAGVLGLLSEYEDERAKFIFSSTTPELYYGYTNNMAVRRSVFETIGPFQEVARGGDVILVRQVVDAYGVNSVRYESRQGVQHLEITSPGVWIRKMFIYGRTTRKYRPIVRTRSMNVPERAEIFRRTLRRHRYAPAKSALLFAMLAGGIGAHLLGRWTNAGAEGQKELAGRARR